LTNRTDWPDNIERVYIDANSIMFVIDRLRHLCLNHHVKQAERTLVEIVTAWNDHMHIEHVELIFHSTDQLSSIGNVHVTSAQPACSTTSRYLLNCACNIEHRAKNSHTIVVTSDQTLAIDVRTVHCSMTTNNDFY
jgi:hypothetical protein